MFPTVRVSFSGPLRGQPSDRYAVLLDVVAVDSRRYRYAYHRSSWLVAGKADPPPPARLYSHPDTPVGADALRKQVISFEKVKLTNNEMDKNGQVRLTRALPGPKLEWRRKNLNLQIDSYLDVSIAPAAHVDLSPSAASSFLTSELCLGLLGSTHNNEA
jgi:T-box